VDLQRALRFRVAFTGLPYGVLEDAMAGVAAGQAWQNAFIEAARKLRGAARQAGREGRRASEARFWLWAARAYHATSLGHHLEPDNVRWRTRALRLRRLAVAAYARGLRADGGIATPVRLPGPKGPVLGYLRCPPHRAAPLVVLLNGLDSVCEAELHAFGDWFLERNMAVLALDVPGCYGLPERTAVLEPETLAPVIASWCEGQPCLRPEALGAFGVSVGGLLAARLASGDPRFVAAVAVSPNAFLTEDLLDSPRFRQMLSVCLGVGDRGLAPLRRRLALDQVAHGSAALLLMEMARDALFGPEHTAAFRAWRGQDLEVRHWDAEHVGTSRVHEWLPAAADWLGAHLGAIGERGGCHA
jgi:hypothetical protein